MSCAKLEVKPIIRWALCLFVFSIYFEGFELHLPFHLTSLTGALLLLAGLLQPRLCYRFPPPPLRWFAGFLYLCVMMALAWGHAAEVLPRLSVLGQLMLMCWVAQNVLRHDRSAREAL